MLQDGSYILEAEGVPQRTEQEEVKPEHAHEEAVGVEEAQPDSPMHEDPSLYASSSNPDMTSIADQIRALTDLMESRFDKLNINHTRIAKRFDRRFNAIEQQLSDLAAQQGSAVMDESEGNETAESEE